jgi:hypothetical protein
MKNFYKNLLKSIRTFAILTAGMALGGMIEAGIQPIMLLIIALSVGLNALTSFMLNEIEKEESECSEQ